MKGSRDVKRYGRVFVKDAGLEEAPAALEELTALSDMLEASRDLKNALIGPQFSDREKASILVAVGNRAGMSEGTVRFAVQLVGNQSVGFLPEIARAATEYYMERKRKARATVVTPAPVGQEYAARLKKALESMTEREVELEYQVDETLIGGLTVHVGSTMYDGSLKGQLRLLKEELIKG